MIRIGKQFSFFFVQSAIIYVFCPREGKLWIIAVELTFAHGNDTKTINYSNEIKTIIINILLSF